MKGKQEQIATLIQRIAAKANGVHAFVGKIVAVNTSKYTCDVKPIDDGAVFYDVKLKPVADSDDHGLIAVPETDSYVIVEPMMGKDVDLYVSQFTRVKTYLIKNSNGVKIMFNSNGELHLNGDQYSGLVKADELKTQIDKNTQILTAIKNACSATAFEAGNGAPSSFQAVMNALIASLQVADLSGIKNNTVKHG